MDTLQAIDAGECPPERGADPTTRARAVIETWRREHNEERPKTALNGLTAAAYAKHMASIG